MSALLSQGVSSEIRKKLAGHSDDNIHEIYSHHEVDTSRHAVQSLPSIAEAANGQFIRLLILKGHFCLKTLKWTTDV